MRNLSTAAPAGPTSPAEDQTPARGDLVAVAIAIGLVVVASAVGYALLNAGVPLNLQAPPLFSRVMPHVGVGSPFAVAIGVLGVLYAVRVSASLGWRRLAPGAVIVAIAWTSSLALVDGWQRGWAGRLTADTEYLHDLPRIGGIGSFLRGFTSHIVDFQPGSWTTHVSSHPPGATLVFLVLERIGLGGGGWAGAVVIAVGSTAGIAVCLTVRALGAPIAARRILPFAVFFPGAVWVGVSADGLFAGVAAWGIAFAVIGSRRGGPGGALMAGAGGLLLGYTAYLSYGLLLVGTVILTALAFAAHRMIWLAALAGAVVVATAFTLAGFNWLDGERLVTIRYYQGVASLRPYSYYVWANLAALTLSAGPAVAAGLRRAVSVALRARSAGLDRETFVPAVLSLAAAVSVIVADLTGLSKAETERIWLPFGFWLIASLALLPKRAVPYALALQVLIALLVNHLELTYW
jgi:hypothetical protein